MYAYKTKSWRKNTPDSAFPRTLSILLKFTYLAEMIWMQQHIHPIAIQLSFFVQTNNFKVIIPMFKNY